MFSNINILSVDIEDWFHILDDPAVPSYKNWDQLEKRVHIGTEKLLQLFEEHKVKATLFCLGWVAERNKKLIRECVAAGHEIACHGYAHLLAYKVGRKNFRKDIIKGKELVEDITGCEVKGFRAAGFSITNNTKWVFDEIVSAGFTYDSSIFPAGRAHGGFEKSPLSPYKIKTENGTLIEIPQSVIQVFNKKISLFGGGYLRISPLWLIRLGIIHLSNSNRPLIIYVHPREFDTDHPRLNLRFKRRFKSYININSTFPKITWLCKNYNFITMYELTQKMFGTSFVT